MQVKDRVLEALEANRGTYFSGEALAQKLAVSRSAVWKAIQQLRESGYPIEAASKRGYCLAKDSAILSAQSIAQYLTVPRLRLEVEQLVSSTNTLLRQRAEAGEPEGLALVAAAQTAGRGRRDHTFFSPPDTGLYLSFLVRPQLSAKDALLLTTCAAAAVALAIEDCAGVPAEIKWVNDVFCRGKKVCGILTEAALDLESGMLDYAVLGLGFNVAAPADGWPEDLRDVAGALYDGSPAPGARAALAAAFLNAFWPLYRAGPRSGYLDEYRRRQALTGQRVLVTPRRGTPRAAQVQGIDDECKLVVRFDGESRPAALNSGEVSVRLL